MLETNRSPAEPVIVINKRARLDLDCNLDPCWHLDQSLKAEWQKISLCLTHWESSVVCFNHYNSDLKSSNTTWPGTHEIGLLVQKTLMFSAFFYHIQNGPTLLLPSTGGLIVGIWSERAGHQSGLMLLNRSRVFSLTTSSCQHESQNWDLPVVKVCFLMCLIQKHALFKGVPSRAATCMFSWLTGWFCSHTWCY